VRWTARAQRGLPGRRPGVRWPRCGQAGAAPAGSALSSPTAIRWAERMRPVRQDHLPGQMSAARWLLARLLTPGAEVRFVYHRPADPVGLRVIYMHDQQGYDIGTLVWRVCPSCRWGSINKISIAPEWQRRGSAGASSAVHCATGAVGLVGPDLVGPCAGTACADARDVDAVQDGLELGRVTALLRNRIMSTPVSAMASWAARRPIRASTRPAAAVPRRGQAVARSPGRPTRCCGRRGPAIAPAGGLPRARSPGTPAVAAAEAGRGQAVV
jgi:hypothetical protein